MAVGQIMGVSARVEGLDMQYLAADPGETAPDGQAANVLVEMQISVDGELFAGRARARDILPCCVAAFIDAASNADAVRAIRARQAARPEAA
jgi:2-isopropylmalate synthase